MSESSSRNEVEEKLTELLKKYTEAVAAEQSSSSTNISAFSVQQLAPKDGNRAMSESSSRNEIEEKIKELLKKYTEAVAAEQLSQQQVTLTEGSSSNASAMIGSSEKENSPPTASYPPFFIASLLTAPTTEKPENNHHNLRNEERIRELNELNDFAATFRVKRKKYEYTQVDVCSDLEKTYGKRVISRESISQFENMMGGLETRRKKRLLLEEWLAERENAATKTVSVPAGETMTSTEGSSSDAFVTLDDSGKPPFFGNSSSSSAASSSKPLANFLQSLITSPTKKPRDCNRFMASRLVKAAKNEFSDGDDDDAHAWARKISEKLSDEDRRHLIELETFAKTFRDKRRSYGHNQHVVRNGLKRVYDRETYTGEKISKFEAMNCSLQTMLSMRPVLEQWLAEIENGAGGGATSDATVTETTEFKKKRTILTSYQRNSLLESFKSNPKPKTEEAVRIAKSLGLEIRVISNWFAKQRQKTKQANKLAEGEVGVATSPVSTTQKHSSPIEESPTMMAIN